MFRSRSNRVLLRSNCLTATAAISSEPPSVPEVAESLVGLSHPVCLFLSLYRAPHVVGGVDQLIGQLFRHAATAPLAREANQPAAGERQPALRADLDRDLVGGAADSPRLDLEERRRVPQSLVKDVQRLFLGLTTGPPQG